MHRATMSGLPRLTSILNWFAALRAFLNLNVDAGLAPGTYKFKELSAQTVVELQEQLGATRGLPKGTATLLIQHVLSTPLEADTE